MSIFLESCHQYDQSRIGDVLNRWEPLFAQALSPGQVVVIKPNWISHCHKYNETEWQSVITHPALITGVLKMVLKLLCGSGQVVITDGPQTQSSWSKIMARMTPELWIEMGRKASVEVMVLDLRDDEWLTEGDVIVARNKLPGDPQGSTVCDLGTFSEFVNHQPSKGGYFGADYNLAETNRAHSNGHHMYKVSRSVMSADVFINLPKMKTHKKAGITCSLKNLVGINTYKNWLPHHMEGTQDEGGDQFPQTSFKSRAEMIGLKHFRSVLATHERMGRWLVPVKAFGRKFFGDTREVIRSGNWYGNQTIWRMILDLNKILLYANPDGTLRNEEIGSRKKYLSIVDAVISGEGNGPEAPDRKETGVLIAGADPLGVDAVCAKLMGFDWTKIPSISNAFRVKHFPISHVIYEDIEVSSSSPKWNKPLIDFSSTDIFHFKPHFGWADHVEAA